MTGKGTVADPKKSGSKESFTLLMSALDEVTLKGVLIPTLTLASLRAMTLLFSSNAMSLAFSFSGAPSGLCKPV